MRDLTPSPLLARPLRCLSECWPIGVVPASTHLHNVIRRRFATLVLIGWLVVTLV